MAHRSHAPPKPVPGEQQDANAGRDVLHRNCKLTIGTHVLIHRRNWGNLLLFIGRNMEINEESKYCTVQDLCIQENTVTVELPVVCELLSKQRVPAGTHKAYFLITLNVVH
jgi:hypothetical protein